MREINVMPINDYLDELQDNTLVEAELSCEAVIPHLVLWIKGLDSE